jgi:ABC-2 type transport system ATP-binding protein
MSDTYSIDVKQLSKSFDGTTVVNNIDLQVKHGEIYGFLGPNGSGKTTTLRMICGLLQPDSGEGHCLGYDILTQSYDIKCHIGYMTQAFSLYTDLTIEENLDFVAQMYGIADRKQAVQKAIDSLAIGRLRKKQLAGRLSGGWKQRLALAAAMIHNPRVLLLDEPTAGVDPAARKTFWDAIERFSEEGITTLVTTHYMDEAARCNRLAYLAYGNMLAKGTAPNIIKEAKKTCASINNLEDVFIYYLNKADDNYG